MKTRGQSQGLKQGTATFDWDENPRWDGIERPFSKDDVRRLQGTLIIEHKDAEGKVIKTIDLTPPWRRIKYKELILERAGADWFDLSPAGRRESAAGSCLLLLNSACSRPTRAGERILPHAGGS